MKLFIVSFLSTLLSISSCYPANQVPLHDTSHKIDDYPSTDGAQMKRMHLSDIVSTDSFTTLTHPQFPNHSVRIKKTENFCDTTVK